MNTSKPISTISYNTKEHLEIVLKRLVFEKKLTFWCYLPHKSEDDEGGKKDHIHLYVEPSKRLNTDELKQEFNQYLNEKDNNLTCIPFNCSKFDDWEQYVLHDPLYLKWKGLEKKYHYEQSEIVSSDIDYLNYKIKSIDNLEKTVYGRMIDAIESGQEWADFFMGGSVPIQQLNNYRYAFDEVYRYLTRDKKKSKK